MSKPIYVTTQRTGKPLKAANTLALASILGAFPMIGLNPDLAAWMLVLGVIVFVVVRILIWWRHD